MAPSTHATVLSVRTFRTSWLLGRHGPFGDASYVSSRRNGRRIEASTIVRKKILTTSASGLAAVALACIYVIIISPRRSLDHFLRELTMVEIGKTSLEDWRRQVERRHLSNVSFKCDQRTCGIGWRGENKLLQRLRLAPNTVVDASVGFKDGIANEIYIAMSTLKRTDPVAQPGYSCRAWPRL